MRSDQAAEAERAPIPVTEDRGGARWRILALLSVAELLGMAVWFTASAVSPQLAELWGLSQSQAGWLTTVVQLGFVAGTAAAAVLNLADILPARPYFAASAVLAALANAAIVAVPDYAAALGFRFLTGFFLAGVYPPAMKMIATWFRSARGLAIGTIVGALTVGKATPYLVRALDPSGYQAVVLVASAGALVAAALVLLGYRTGPHPFGRRPFSWGLIGTVLRHRETRLSIFGYLGHMWELYAMWTLVSIFFFDFFLAAGRDAVAATGLSGLLGFAVIGMGGIGAVLAGKWADALGRERVAIGSLVVSGACSLTIGWLIGAPAWIVVTLALVWGFAIVADSAQFSALVTEVAPQHAVGTALTLQTMLGFALTGVSIQLAIAISEGPGWGPAFAMMAVGPVFGVWAMARLGKIRKNGFTSDIG